MKGTNLGEFEELVLLIVAGLFEQAYGLKIQEEIKSKAKRNVSISTVHATLHRLKKKGYLTSEYDNTEIGSRGGRPRLIFRVTKSGFESIQAMKELRNSLWDNIGDIAFN